MVRSPVLSVPKTNYGQFYGVFYGVFCREVKGLRGICLSQLLVPIIRSCWGYFVLGSRTGRLSLLSHSLPQCRPEAATPCNKWHGFHKKSPPDFSRFLAQISPTWSHILLSDQDQRQQLVKRSEQVSNYQGCPFPFLCFFDQRSPKRK